VAVHREWHPLRRRPGVPPGMAVPCRPPRFAPGPATGSSGEKETINEPPSIPQSSSRAPKGTSQGWQGLPKVDFLLLHLLEALGRKRGLRSDAVPSIPYDIALAEVCPLTNGSPWLPHLDDDSSRSPRHMSSQRSRDSFVLLRRLALHRRCQGSRVPPASSFFTAEPPPPGPRLGRPRRTVLCRMTETTACCSRGCFMTSTSWDVAWATLSSADWPPSLRASNQSSVDGLHYQVLNPQNSAGHHAGVGVLCQAAFSALVHSTQRTSCMYSTVLAGSS